MLRRVLLPHPLFGEFESDKPLIPAAVLFPLVQREEGFHVLLTQRTAHLRDHPGQISFPGGRVDATDRSVLDTALREAREEIGLPRDQVDVLGYLPEHNTRTGFRVVPVVGVLAPPHDLKLDSFEVDNVFEVPLAFFLDRSNHEQGFIMHEEIKRPFLAIPFGNRYIWGATAMMILSLVERIEKFQSADQEG